MKALAPLATMSSRGFTLVEVLVSSAVLAIVMAIMFSTLSTSMNLWRNTDNKIVADREARAVGLMMGRDLANAIVPADPNLWPRTTNVVRVDEFERATTNTHLRFLTIAPSEQQSAQGREAGDVCYVDYAIVSAADGVGLELKRFFLPSGETHTNVVRAGVFPEGLDLEQYQSLGLYLLPTNSMAARGLGALATAPREMAYNTNRLVVLGTNMLPLTGDAGNYPTAVEVNFAVADPETLSNPDIMGMGTYILRNAGLYSFRIPLPKPAEAP